MAEEQKKKARFFYVKVADVSFYDVEDSPGLGYAVLHGDPAKEGVYTIRVRIPPGTVFPPHFHDKDRHVTVLSGVWSFGAGKSGDCSKAIELRAGAYALHPKGAVHYDGACTSRFAEIQITGAGPVNTTWLERSR